jgi:hypothetical protein
MLTQESPFDVVIPHRMLSWTPRLSEFDRGQARDRDRQSKDHQQHSILRQQLASCGENTARSTRVALSLTQINTCEQRAAVARRRPAENHMRE